MFRVRCLREWWVCGQAWQCPLSKQHPILSAMVGPDGLNHMAYGRVSITEPKTLQLISRFLAYTIPCLYFVGHACGAEPLLVQIILVIRNVTMSCLFWTEIRRDSRLFSHLVSLHAWQYCSTFLSSDVVRGPYIVSPSRLPCFVCINNPVFWSGMQIICWRIHTVNWADCNTHQWIGIFIIYIIHLIISLIRCIQNKLCSYLIC